MRQEDQGRMQEGDCNVSLLATVTSSLVESWFTYSVAFVVAWDLICHTVFCLCAPQGTHCPWSLACTSPSLCSHSSVLVRSFTQTYQ